MLIGAAGDSKVGRYLVVGGVGSSTWRRVFPWHTRPRRRRARPFWNAVQQKQLNWTFLSPSALFVAGELGMGRTQKPGFRQGSG